MATVTCELEASYTATAGAGGGDKAMIGGKLVGVPHEQRRFTFTFAGNGKGKGRRLGGGGGGGTPAGSWYGGLLLRRRTGGGGRMQVFVRTLAGKSLALDVSPSDTVDAVKARIQAKERVAARDQRLVFAGRDLAGVLATMVAGAALACFPSAAAAAGTGGGLILALLLLLWALAMAGVNLITAGVCLTGRAETLGKFSAAFVRQNHGVLGIAAGLLAATGVIVFASDRAICFISFAVFLLLAMSLVTIGVAIRAR
ncbi:unnamed protein product [Urochloa humidicola]